MFFVIGGFSSVAVNNDAPIYVGAVLDIVAAVALIVISRKLISEGKMSAGIKAMHFIGTLETIASLFIISSFVKEKLCNCK